MNNKLFIFFVIFNLASYAQPEFLDSTFGIGGKVSTDFPGIYINDDYVYSVKIQANGKIVVAGTSGRYFALARYYNDGSLDSTFGGNGKVTTGIGSYRDFVRACAIQNDGKILVAGTASDGTNMDFAIVRYNIDGTLDGSFGLGGIVTTAIGNGDDFIFSIAIQEDGKILAAGGSNSSSTTYSNFDFALARFNVNGSIDSTFGANGKKVIDFGSDSDGCVSVLIQSDKKIVIAGSSGNDFALVRFNPNGTLDNTFGIGGKRKTNHGAFLCISRSAAVQPDDKIVVVGLCSKNKYDDYILERFTSNGSIDTMFGNNGQVFTDFSGFNDRANSICIQNDGKLIVAGSSNDSLGTKFSLCRYNYDGTLDSTLGYAGKITTRVGNYSDAANSCTLDDNGNILLSGYRSVGASADFAVVRYGFNNAVGIKENIIRSDLNIFPNPSSGILTILVNTKIKEIGICIYDVNGNCIWNKNSQNELNQKIDLSSKAKGIYFMEVVTGDERVVKKIVLE